MNSIATRISRLMRLSSDIQNIVSLLNLLGLFIDSREAAYHFKSTSIKPTPAMPLH